MCDCLIFVLSCLFGWLHGSISFQLSGRPQTPVWWSSLVWSLQHSRRHVMSGLVWLGGGALQRLQVSCSRGAGRCQDCTCTALALHMHFICMHQTRSDCGRHLVIRHPPSAIRYPPVLLSSRMYVVYTYNAPALLVLLPCGAQHKTSLPRKEPLASPVQTHLGLDGFPLAPPHIHPGSSWVILGHPQTPQHHQSATDRDATWH